MFCLVGEGEKKNENFPCNQNISEFFAEMVRKLPSLVGRRGKKASFISSSNQSYRNNVAVKSITVLIRATKKYFSKDCRNSVFRIVFLGVRQ